MGRCDNKVIVVAGGGGGTGAATSLRLGRERTPAPCSRRRSWRALAATWSPRLGDPEDIAAVAAFLLSDEAVWINGQVLDVNGGRLLG
jgi:Enoyl-(Acyl carrier protein) reductase